MLLQPKTEGGSRVRMQRLVVPFDACSSQRKAIEVRPIIYLSSPLDDRKRDHMLPGWRVRVRPPEFGGYPSVTGTRCVALLLLCLTSFETDINAKQDIRYLYMMYELVQP